jgi:hypothetical protein
MPVTWTDFFDIAANLVREQAKQAKRIDTPGMCPWCAKIDGHESYCSVYDDPLTNYEMGACEECGGTHLHVEGCMNVERVIKFIERTEESC